MWEMIPAVYRHEDGLAENPDMLRAIVEVFAEQASRLRRSHDWLWEDQFVELSKNWAVPYIGDLVGTRMVSALNKRARRVDVAKTIYYRRRKGTLAVLEELISDITGWEGNVVEGFRRLARTRHGLDPEPSNYAGRFTGTLPGGFADLRSVHTAEMSHSAFDEFFHTPDMRKPKGKDGLYGIQRLLFYIYRLRAFKVRDVMPGEFDGTGGLGFTFDPSGRDTPLYMPRNRPHHQQISADGQKDWGKWRPSYEWELVAPMRCRILGHAEYIIEDKDIIELVEDDVLDNSLADELKQLSDIHYKTEQCLHDAIDQLPSSATLLEPSKYIPIIAAAIINKCGKQVLYPNAVYVNENGNTISAEQITAGNLTLMQTDASKRIQIDPERGRLLFIGDLPDKAEVTYHVGFATEIGADSYDRISVEQYTADEQHSGGGEITAAHLMNDGVTQIVDSASYGPIGSKVSVKNLVFIAANQQRPYIRLDGNWVLDTGINKDSKLVIDGLWIGAEVASSVKFRGDYKEVTLRHVTFDPGGPKTKDPGSDELPAISIVVEGNIEKLVVDASIIGAIELKNDSYVKKIEITDSIVQSRDETVKALQLPDSDLHLDRVTVVGDVQTQRLEASDSLIVGEGDIANTQSGCFRFSAAKIGSRLPRPYRSVWITKSNVLFSSTRFGDPAFMQLSQNAPKTIMRGAEKGSEMGAYNSLINPIKLDGLRAKVEEYMPFGLLPLFIFET